MKYSSFKKYAEMAAFANPGNEAPEVISYPALRNLLLVVPNKLQPQIIQWALHYANHSADKGRTIMAKDATAILRKLMKQNGAQDINNPLNTIYPEDFFVPDRIRELAKKQWNVNPDALMGEIDDLYDQYKNEHEPKSIPVEVDGEELHLPMDKLNDKLKALKLPPFSMTSLIKQRENNPYFNDPVKRDPRGRKGIGANQGISLGQTRFGTDPDTGMGVYSGRDYDYSPDSEYGDKVASQLQRAFHQQKEKDPDVHDPDFEEIRKNDSIKKRELDKKDSLESLLQGRGGATKISVPLAEVIVKLVQKEIADQLNGIPAPVINRKGEPTLDKDGKQIMKMPKTLSSKYDNPLNFVPRSFTVKSGDKELRPGEQGTPGVPYTVTYKGFGKEGENNSQNPFRLVTDENGEQHVIMQKYIWAYNPHKPTEKVAVQPFALYSFASKRPENADLVKQALDTEVPRYDRDLGDIGDIIKKVGYNDFEVDIDQLLQDGWKVKCTECRGLGKKMYDNKKSYQICNKCLGKRFETDEQIHNTPDNKQLVLEKGADQKIRVTKTRSGWTVQSPADLKDLTPEEKEKIGNVATATGMGVKKGSGTTVKAHAKLANKESIKSFQDDWMNNPEKWGESGPVMDDRGNPNPGHSLGGAALVASKRRENLGRGATSMSDGLSSAFNRAQGFYNDSRFAYGDLSNDRLAANLGKILNDEEAVKAWLKEMHDQQNDHTKPVMITNPSELINPALKSDPRFDQIMQVFRKNGADWRRYKFSSIAKDIDDVSSHSIDKSFGDDGGSMSANIAGDSSGAANRIAGGGMADLRVKNDNQFNNFTLQNKLVDPGLLKSSVHSLFGFGPMANATMASYKKENRDSSNYQSYYKSNKKLGYNVLKSENLDSIATMLQGDLTNPDQAKGVLDAAGDIYLTLLKYQIDKKEDSTKPSQDKKMLADYSKFFKIIESANIDSSIKNKFISLINVQIQNIDTDLLNKKHDVELQKPVETGMPSMVKKQFLDAIQAKNYAGVGTLLVQHNKLGHELDKYQIFKTAPNQLEQDLDKQVNYINNIFSSARRRLGINYGDVNLNGLEEANVEKVANLLQKLRADARNAMKDEGTSPSAAEYNEIIYAVMRDFDKSFGPYVLGQDKMPSFAEYRLRKQGNNFMETGAIYDGSATYSSTRDWNWWGCPDSYKKKKKKKST